MSDRIFSGRDVAEALDLAARQLGQARAQLRYVVLDPGGAGGRGLSATPARVAVLLERAPAAQRAPEATRPVRSEGDPSKELRTLVEELRTVAGIDVEVEIEEDDGLVRVDLNGRDREFFYGPADSGEVLRALEALLQAVYSRWMPGGRVVASVAGFAERREEALGELARRLAEEVRADGVPRLTPPLNSFERRLVHIAARALDGIVTYSVGEGSDRRVTVALELPAGPETDSGEASGSSGD